MGYSGNNYGGSVVLTTTYKQLEETPRGMRYLTIRPASGASAVQFSNDGIHQTGFLSNGNETKTFFNTDTASVWVKGTAGNVLYWDGQS